MCEIMKEVKKTNRKMRNKKPKPKIRKFSFWNELNKSGERKNIIVRYDVDFSLSLSLSLSLLSFSAYERINKCALKKQNKKMGQFWRLGCGISRRRGAVNALNCFVHCSTEYVLISC